MKHILYLGAAVLATLGAAAPLFLTSCKSATQAAQATTGATRVAPAASQVAEPQPMAVAPEQSSVAFLPKAMIYRTSAPSDSLVPITVVRGMVTNFPAPTDLGNPPARLLDGWMLDSRGINPQTAFTTWTYSEYKALKTVPPTEELLSHVVNGLRVTEIVALPLNISEVTPALADSLIKNGLQGCTITYREQ